MEKKENLYQSDTSQQKHRYVPDGQCTANDHCSGMANHYKWILNNMPYAFVFCRVVYENGRAVDFIHEEVNDAYEKLTGLQNVIGRRFTEVMQGISESNPEFMAKHIRVAESGVPERFEEYVGVLDRWYNITLHCPEKGFLIAVIDEITDRKLAEKELQESKERFEAIIDASGVGIWDWNIQTGTVVWNDRWFEIAGYRREELEPLGLQTWMNLSHPEDLEQSKVILNEHFIDDSKDYEHEYRRKHKNGEWVWVQDRGRLWSRSEDGRPLRMLGINHDISKRKKAETDLKQSEEQFRRLFQDHSAIMMVINPENGSIVDANQSAANFYGWSIETLCQMAIHQINTLPEKILKQRIAEYHASHRTNFEFRHRIQNGSIRDVEIFANNIEFTNRTLTYLIINDITKRKRLESQALIRIRLLEKASVLSVDNLLQYTLDELERVTGSTIGFTFLVAKDQNTLRLQTVSTNTATNMCHAEKRKEHYPLNKAGVWADAIRVRKPVIHNDYAAFKHDRSMPEGHVEVTRELVVPVIREGLVVAVLGIGNKPSDYDAEDSNLVSVIADQAWDIIEKKQSEERYSQIEEQLHHSRKMELIGQLASGIAHEINNPLNFITINFTTQQEYFADLVSIFNDYRNVMERCDKTCPWVGSELQKLHQKEEEIRIDSLVQEMNDIFYGSQKGINRIKKIVDGMRSLSYRHAIDKKVFYDINKGVTDTLIVSGNEYRFCADIVTEPGQIPQVPCIPDQINQVLLNLIINSAHAIQSQQRSSNGKIGIRTWADSQHVYCSVTDDGPGVPDTVRKDIFNPFFTTKAAGKGTGLGLSISYDIIVNKHNGTLTVNCPQEGGTVFTFSLPLNITNESQDPNKKSD